MSKASNTFFSNKVQEIHTTLEGVITESSDTIFKLKTGDNIFNFHPFFESLEGQLKNGKETDLAFPCVQMDIEENHVICDVTIKKEVGFLAILLFDYSNHYENLHDAAQEKKTAMLNEQAYELNSKHSEEKKAYFEFIQSRVNNKIVKNLANVLQDLDSLKNSDLNSEQINLVERIQTNIQNLHKKAAQINEGLKIDLD